MNKMIPLQMDTTEQESSCGGPPVYVDAPCPKCAEKGQRVKSGTVKALLNKSHRADVKDKTYGVCMTPDCDVSWYANDGTHHFTIADTATQIWTKSDAKETMACYCNEITKQMVTRAVKDHGLNDMVSIIKHYRGAVVSKCAVRNPAGRCCTEGFNQMINEAMVSE